MFCGFNCSEDVASNSSSFQCSIETFWLIMKSPKPLADSCMATVLMLRDVKDGFIVQRGQWLLKYSSSFNHPGGRSESHCPASALANLKILILRASVFSWECGNSKSCVGFLDLEFIMEKGRAGTCGLLYMEIVLDRLSRSREVARSLCLCL